MGTKKGCEDASLPGSASSTSQQERGRRLGIGRELISPHPKMHSTISRSGSNQLPSCPGESRQAALPLCSYQDGEDTQSDIRAGNQGHQDFI